MVEQRRWSMPSYVVERTFSRRARDRGRRGRRAGVARRRRAERGGRGDVGALVRLGRLLEDLLRLRRAEPGGDPELWARERSPGRPDHEGARARPVLPPLKGASWRPTSSCDAAAGE